MSRIHAFEFEDLRKLHSNLRNYATDFLQFGANAFDLYRPVIPVLQKGIECSGLIRKLVLRKVNQLMSDIYLELHKIA